MDVPDSTRPRQNTPDQTNFKKRAIWFLAAFVLSCIVYWCGGVLEPSQRTVLAIVTIAVVLWISEVIPLYITSLIASFLLIVIAGFEPKEIFAPYFDSVIVLFLGGFVLARGLQKHGLDSFLAQSLLRRVGSNPYMFILGIMSVTAFLSMWMSNTAAAAVMVPICVVVLRENNLFSNTSGFARGCLLAVAYAATIGGIGTVVGSPPNAIAVRLLASNPTEIVELSFIGWMIQALPFVVVTLIFVWIMLCILNKPEVTEIRFVNQEGKFTRKQALVLAIFGVTALGWLSTQLTGLASATIALIPIILLYGFGLLDDTDLGKISWGTLLLFGGGLSLGGALTKVRIDILIAENLTRQLHGLHVFFILITLIYFGILITMIASNTASAAILVPLMIPVAKGVGLDVQTMATVIAIGVSLDFMMPVGTPPNAIVYSTGLVRVKEMMKNGAVINIGAGLILALMYYLFWI